MSFERSPLHSETTIHFLTSDTGLRAWDAFAQSHPSGEFCHLSGHALSQTGSWMQPFVVAAMRGESITAGALVYRVGPPKLPWCFYYAPRGFLLDSAQACFPLLLAALRAKADREGAIYLKTDPALEAREAFHYQDAGFVRYEEEGYPGLLHPRFEARLRVDRTEEELLASFKSPTRRGIGKAVKQGIEIFQDTEGKHLREFFEIYKIIGETNHFFPRPFSYIERLWTHLAPGRAALFCARHEGKVIAAILVLFTDQACWLLYGGGRPEYGHLRYANLLHWEIIRWSRARGHAWCSFRGVPGVTVHESNEGYGLWKFKMGFGATVESWTPPLEYAFRPDLYLLGKEMETTAGRAIVTIKRIPLLLTVARELRRRMSPGKGSAGD